MSKGLEIQILEGKLSLVTSLALSVNPGVLSFAVTMLLGALFSLPSLLLDCTEPSSGDGTPTTSFSKGKDEFYHFFQCTLIPIAKRIKQLEI